MEKVPDLLVPASGASIKLWSRGNGFVANASQRVVDIADNLLRLFSESEGNQSVGSTAMNKRSSRSRTVLMITVKRTVGDKITMPSLCLVNLAGSESVKVTDGATAEHLQEGSARPMASRPSQSCAWSTLQDQRAQSTLVQSARGRGSATFSTRASLHCPT